MLTRLCFIIGLHFLLSVQVLSQATFFSGGFDTALKTSASQGKLLMVILDSKTCYKCNEATTIGLLSEDARKINDSCLIFRPAVNSRFADSLRRIHLTNPDEAFAVLFFDETGTVVYRVAMTSNQSATYLNFMRTAFSRSLGNKQVAVLEKEWQSQPSSLALTKRLIELRLNNRMESDSLVQHYVRLLPADSLATQENLKLMLISAPIIASAVDSLMYKYYPQLQKAWLIFKKNEQDEINFRKINKSMDRAVADKNLKLGVLVANYSKNIQGSKRIGEYVFYREFLRYCYAAKDTLNYFRQADLFAKDFFMSLAIDSLDREDSLMVNKWKNEPDTSANTATKTMSGSALKPNAIASRREKVGMELNRLAWQVYELYRNPTILLEAQKWSKRSVEMIRLPEFLDTYGRLLYQTGDVGLAIEQMKIAVQICDDLEIPNVEFTAILRKMEMGLPLR